MAPVMEPPPTRPNRKEACSHIPITKSSVSQMPAYRQQTGVYKKQTRKALTIRSIRAIRVRKSPSSLPCFSMFKANRSALCAACSFQGSL